MQTKYDQHRNPMEAAIDEMRWCVETIDASLTAAAHSAVHMDARVALILQRQRPARVGQGHGELPSCAVHALPQAHARLRRKRFRPRCGHHD